MATSATAFKEQGNKEFQAGNFKEAEGFYTRAIQRDPQNPIYFTNRAFARIKLSSWNPCIDDCLSAISLSPSGANMKSYYYLAQAQLALRHPNEALSSALTAYDLCLKSNNASTGNISALVLQAKKEKWEVRERERMRGRSGLLGELEDALRRAEAEAIHELEDRLEGKLVTVVEGEEEKSEIRDGARRKVEDLRSCFAIADPANLKRREVPDYMIDNISFAFIHDPVVTKTGQSYERATILEHLKHSTTDPLTRLPLSRDDLRPNLALKQACAEFLEENGWAVDW